MIGLSIRPKSMSDAGQWQQVRGNARWPRTASRRRCEETSWGSSPSFSWLSTGWTPRNVRHLIVFWTFGHTNLWFVAWLKRWFVQVRLSLGSNIYTGSMNVAYYLEWLSAVKFDMPFLFLVTGRRNQENHWHFVHNLVFGRSSNRWIVK